jgi:hypothetical protein
VKVELSRFVYHASCEQAIRSDTGMGAALARVSTDSAVRSRAISPMRTGAYIASIRAAAVRGAGGYEGVVTAGVPYAGYIEYGTVDTAEFAPLRRGLAVG